MNSSIGLEKLFGDLQASYTHTLTESVGPTLLMNSLVCPCLLQDPQASYDVNSNDVDPMPRYDATNENK